MAERKAIRQDAIAQLAIALPRLRSVSVAVAAPAIRLSLRAGGPTAAFTEAYGVELPRQACRSATAGSRAALWLGPDEWLLIAEETSAATEPASAQALAGVLADALAAVPHSLVDISHRQAALTIAGQGAAAALNAACPLDLSLSAFPVGACTRTLFGKAEIVLWRRHQSVFHLEAWRSFLGYVAGVLEIGCRDAASVSYAR